MSSGNLDFLTPLIRYKVQVLWVITSLLCIYFIFFTVKNATRSSYGFASYYTASNLLIEGESVADFYDDDWFSSKVEEHVPGVYEIYLVNMPTTSLLFLPIAGFDYKSAKLIWNIFNLVFLFVIVWFIINQMKFSDAWLPFVLLIFLSFQPIYANIFFGQVYIFIFCLLVLGWFALESGNEKLTGIIIGLVFILKTAGLFLFVLLIVQKKWKSLLWAFFIVAILFFVTLPFLKLDSWSAYTNRLFDYSSSPTLSVTAYQSIHSFFHHLFIFDKRWNPEPLIILPFIGKSLTIIFSILILIVTVISTYRYKKSDLAFGMFIIVGIILSPASIDYHYILLLIPILILLNWLRKNQSQLLWSVFIGSVILIAISLPYTSSKISSGIWSVFAYPKLYGALILWVLSLRATYLFELSRT